MNEYDERTSGLLGKLTNVNSEVELEKYLDEHTIKKMRFGDYYTEILNSKNITQAQAIKNSGLAKSYACQIINDTKTNPGRDKVIALCLGAHMDINETKRALEITCNAPLYPKNPKDAIIIININKSNWSVPDINLELDKHGIEEFL